MITINNWIWTTRGWRTAEEVYVGEKIISFNASRNCCEYDEIKSIELAFVDTGGVGVQKFGTYLLTTTDHPIICVNNDKTTERYATKDVFLKTKTVLYNRWFEPYHRTQSEEDIRWSARIAATYNKTRFAPVLNDVRSITSNFGGIEARWWLESFFQWTVLVNNVNFMKNTRVFNREVREIALNVAARAGVGSDYDKSWRQAFGGIKVFSITRPTDLKVSVDTGWFSKPLKGLVYNLTTKNGNFLGRGFRGNFLITCKEQN